MTESESILAALHGAGADGLTWAALRKELPDMGHMEFTLALAELRKAGDVREEAWEDDTFLVATGLPVAVVPRAENVTTLHGGGDDMWEAARAAWESGHTVILRQVPGEVRGPVERTGVRVMRLLTTHGPLTANQVKARGFSATTRGNVDLSLALLAERGQIVPLPAGRWGLPGA